jgi:DNA-binding NarL/FixJ family response regulator
MNILIPHVRVLTQDPALLNTLTRLLIDSGFHVSASLDPEESLTFIERAHPAIVLCDCNLEGGGSLETVRRIKRSSPETRIVLLSSRSDWAFYEELLHKNGDTVCPRRPLRPLTVLHAIERAMEGASA